MTFLLLVIATASLGLLAWRIDMGVVASALAQVGWGMVLIIGQEIVAHLLNAVAWRLAFSPGEAASVPLGELVRLRVAGDAVNYLTPTATLGGEVARGAMLRAAHDSSVGAVSVVIAKATQTLAQATFITAGLFLVASQWWSLATFASALAGTIVAMSLGALGVSRLPLRWRARVAGLWDFFRHHPDRAALSTLMFALGYGWGVFEAYWICRLLGLPVPILTAVAIEVLSITVDGILFMIPAKIGTQEGGKAAVFAALGLPVALGFAFGITRHVRELAWAALGVVICYASVGRGGRVRWRAARGRTGSQTTV